MQCRENVFQSSSTSYLKIDLLAFLSPTAVKCPRRLLFYLVHGDFIYHCYLCLIRTFAPIATAHANSHFMHRAHAHALSKMMGEMAIATALCGFKDLGHLVTPTFLSRNILFSMIYTSSRNEQKLSVGS